MVSQDLFSSKVIMVRPTAFHSNEQTQADNVFMAESNGALSREESTIQAQSEFDAFVVKLKESGLSVHLYEQSADDLPDSVFPNNWFSTHHGDFYIKYPMATENREREKTHP
jgi:hypothetical protein